MLNEAGAIETKCTFPRSHAFNHINMTPKQLRGGFFNFFFHQIFDAI